MVATLPPGYETTIIEGDTYYVYDDAYYQSQTKDGSTEYVAVEPPEQATQPSTPSPITLLQQMSDYLAKVQQFSIEAIDTMDQVLESGQKIQLSTKRTVHVSRPGKIRGDVKGDNVDRGIWYDGKTLTMLDRTPNMYAVTDMPDSIDAMLDEVARRFAVTIPLADLFYSDAYKALLADTKTNVARYIGKTKLNSSECHHLAFESDALDWQIWIEIGKRPLPRKLVITYKQEEGNPRYIVTLRKWNLSPQFPKDHFTFQPPARAEQIEMLPIVAAEGKTTTKPAR